MKRQITYIKRYWRRIQSFLDALYYHGLVLNKLDKKEEALEKLNKALELKESTLSDVNHENIRNAIKEIENS